MFHVHLLLALPRPGINHSLKEPISSSGEQNLETEFPVLCIHTTEIASAAAYVRYTYPVFVAIYLSISLCYTVPVDTSICSRTTGLIIQVSFFSVRVTPFSYTENTSPTVCLLICLIREHRESDFRIANLYPCEKQTY